MAVAERYKAGFSCRSFAGIQVSNPAGVMGVCVVCCAVKAKEEAKKIQIEEDR
jgi:hypothetical protein